MCHDRGLLLSAVDGVSALYYLRPWDALIKLTTLPGQLVLDPFCGSGSTRVAAKSVNRNVTVHAPYFCIYLRLREYALSRNRRVWEH